MVPGKLSLSQKQECVRIVNSVTTYQICFITIEWWNYHQQIWPDYSSFFYLGFPIWTHFMHLYLAWMPNQCNPLHACWTQQSKNVKLFWVTLGYWNSCVMWHYATAQSGRLLQGPLWDCETTGIMKWHTSRSREQHYAVVLIWIPSLHWSSAGMFHCAVQTLLPILYSLTATPDCSAHINHSMSA